MSRIISRIIRKADVEKCRAFFNGHSRKRKENVAVTRQRRAVAEKVLVAQFVESEQKIMARLQILEIGQDYFIASSVTTDAKGIAPLGATPDERPSGVKSSDVKDASH